MSAGKQFQLSFCSLSLDFRPPCLPRIPPRFLEATSAQGGCVAGGFLVVICLYSSTELCFAPSDLWSSIHVALCWVLFTTGRGPGPALRRCTRMHVPWQEMVSRDDLCLQSPSLSWHLSHPCQFPELSCGEKGSIITPTIINIYSLLISFLIFLQSGSRRFWSRLEVERSQESLPLQYRVLPWINFIVFELSLFHFLPIHPFIQGWSPNARKYLLESFFLLSSTFFWSTEQRMT